MTKRAQLAAAAGLLVLVAGCTAGPADEPVPARGFGRLSGLLGPGVPPQGGVPDPIDLRFTHGTEVVAAQAQGGRFAVDLRPGTWSVAAVDGRACMSGIDIQAGASYHHDLVYPANGCQDTAAPPRPRVPPAPPRPR